MVSLVGYTGFVGSNIYAAGKEKIDGIYNSKNIQDAYGTSPDLLIYAGMRAEKYLANRNPEADMQRILQAEDNIRRIHPKKLVLISTVDVFNDTRDKDEDAEINTDNLHAYGYNRYQLEKWVRKEYTDALIIRLPGLYGINIKKNFIYDYINVIPFMLNKTKFQELAARDRELALYYNLQENGFYQCCELTNEEKKMLRDKFNKLGFTALNFTDSRSVYQFYPLFRLWSDIEILLDTGITMWHPATEPVSAGEIYEYLTGTPFINEITDQPAYYNYRTKHDKLFGGGNGYLLQKEQVLEDIRNFVRGSENELIGI